MAYWKSGTRDPGHLQVQSQDPRPGTPKCLGSGTPKVRTGTQDSKIFMCNQELPIFYSFKSFIIHLTLRYSSILHCTSLVTKFFINMFIRLTYFIANIQKQTLRVGRNLIEL